MEYTINGVHKVSGEYVGSMGSAPQFTVGAAGFVSVYAKSFYVNTDGYGIYISNEPMSLPKFTSTFVNHKRLEERAI